MDEKRIEIYHGLEGEVIFDVDTGGETIWASQEQISKLFGVDRTVVGRHLRNIYNSGELEENRTSAKNAYVGMEGTRKVRREIKKYNLDAIISVGYRVNSRKATDFRIWATGVLKSYVVNGVAINDRKLENLEGALSVVRRLMTKSELGTGEASGILEVIAKYAGSFRILKEKREGQVVFQREGQVRRGISRLDFENLVENLRKQEGEGEKFGEIRGEGKEFFRFLDGLGEEGGEVAEKAVRLLYFVVKERPFLDGNRRIGALLFIFFLTVNDCHLTEAGETKVSDRALAAITLLIAESEPEEKELVIGVVKKLLE